MAKRMLVLVLTLVALLGGATAAWAQTGLSKADLHAQNNSGETGQVVLTGQADGTTQVEITLSGATGLSQPAHIHAGSCANLNPKPAYPLNNVVDGHSVTTVNVPISSLLGGNYAVNVHKSATDIGTYVACADLTALMSGGGTNTGGTGGSAGGTSGSPGMPATGQPDLGSLALLGLIGAGLLVAIGGRLRQLRAR
ncbi:MAG TPA: hypothetical protein VKY74_20300 [Chloroflexia bacterium]|nr:hypothetical protein [Chloroflexia bacterium]